MLCHSLVRVFEGVTGRLRVLTGSETRSHTTRSLDIPARDKVPCPISGRFPLLIMLIRLFFASICMYNPARLDFI
jgi:hypothetical protein